MRGRDENETETVTVGTLVFEIVGEAHDRERK